ncbi:MAG TPA: hypothetical protein VFD45_01070 [Patescibacteria group bacterium]|nr:hypothetical protein [Patescibacteria group bacterium]
MEREKRKAPQVTFEQRLDGVMKLLNDNVISEEEAFLRTAIYAVGTLQNISDGLGIDSTYPLAYGFLERNWKKIPKDIKLGFMPKKGKRQKSKRKAK